MPGWRIVVAARASLKKRSTIVAVARELGQQHLDRGAACPMQRVLGAVDDAHAALAELRDDPVAPHRRPNHGSPGAESNTALQKGSNCAMLRCCNSHRDLRYMDATGDQIGWVRARLLHRRRPFDA